MGEFLGSLVGKLIGGFVGIAMIGGGVYYSLTKKDNLGEEFKRPPHAIEIFDENYNVPLMHEFGKETSEKLKIKVELDEDNNILYVGNYTQDYNRKDWSGTEKELIPVNERHTTINHVYSKTFVLHPPEVKISQQEQRAFLVPQYKWDKNLKPYEEHEEAQMAIEGGEMLIDWALEQIPIPFFKDFIEEGIKNATAKEWRDYEEMFERLKAGYTATIIPSQIPNKILGYTETARESKIYFDMSETEGEVPLYIWAKIALGDPSKASHGSFPNKYGQLENIVIGFSLMGGKGTIAEEPQKLEDYFFQGKELKNIKIFPHNGFEGIPENPYIFSPEEVARVKDLRGMVAGSEEAVARLKYLIGMVGSEEDVARLKYLIAGSGEVAGIKDLTGMGVAYYHSTPTKTDFVELKISVWQFENDINVWKFLEERGHGIITFVKDNAVSMIEFPQNLRINKEFIYLNSLINYEKRIKAEVYFGDSREVYRKWNIPPSNSGKYFIETLEFQERFYGMNADEIVEEATNFIIDSAKKYGINTEKLERKGIKNFIPENVELREDINKKFCLMLPSLSHKFFDLFGGFGFLCFY